MDVVIIDVPDAWGMLLSRKWTTTLEGSIQMDLSYATILTYDGTFVTLYRRFTMRHQVEDPKVPLNELIWDDEEFGDLGVFTNSIVLMKEEDHCGRKYFKDIKEAITSASILISPDYSQDLLIFLFASEILSMMCFHQRARIKISVTKIVSTKKSSGSRKHRFVKIGKTSTIYRQT
jgi:hypothetical protein